MTAWTTAARVILPSLIFRTIALIAPLCEDSLFLLDALLAVLLIVIKGVQIAVVVEMARVLDHISAVLIWRMDIWDEIEQVQILRQAANLSGALRICIGRHSL